MCRVRFAVDWISLGDPLSMNLSFRLKRSRRPEPRDPLILRYSSNIYDRRYKIPVLPLRSKPGLFRVVVVLMTVAIWLNNSQMAGDRRLDRDRAFTAPSS